MFDVSLAI